MNIVKRNSLINRIEEEHVYLHPDPKVIWDYFGYMLPKLRPLNRSQVNRMISKMVYKLPSRISPDFESDSLRPEQDLIITVSELEALNKEFKYLKTYHLQPCVKLTLRKNERDAVMCKEIKPMNRNQIMERVFKLFIREYVIIRSIIRHDAIQNKLKVAFIPCSLQTYTDYANSKNKQAIPHSLQPPKQSLSDETDVKKEEAQFEKTRRRYDKKLGEIRTVEKKIEEAKSKGISPLTTRMEEKLAKLHTVFDHEFNKFDFFLDDPTAITNPSTRKRFVEKWIPILNDYYAERFKIEKIGIAEIIGVLFNQIGLGLKNKNDQSVTVHQHARWALKHIH